jgi:hypothetical protein
MWISKRPRLFALLAYGILALAFNWPLPLHMGTHLTGSPEGDTGVYVWNQWVFQRELLTRHANPYFTDRIFALTDRANLSLNNYTTFADLLALPFVRVFGTVATFNAVYLLIMVLTAFSMYLLARAVTHGAEYESWLAGALFAWSPMLVTRGAGHFSLVAAAPLPLFVLLLMRVDRYRRLRDAAALGLLLALALWSDVYYPVYCVLLAIVYVLWRTVSIERRQSGPAGEWRGGRVVDLLIAVAGAVVVAILISGGWAGTLLGRRISVRELYTPVLVLTTLICVRIAARYRATVVPIGRADVVGFARLALCAGVAAAIPLLPLLYALGVRVVAGSWVSPVIYWRSSPSGVDLLAMALPNPNHALAPEAWRAWLSARPDGYLESVASIPLTAMAVLGLAWYRGWRAPRIWLLISVAFAWMSLGPFLRIAGVNTYIPGPWALLRYAPVIGLARNPARFAVLLMLGLAMLFALAVRFLTEASAAHRTKLRWAIGTVLMLELIPAPRYLHPAGYPAIYDRIASDQRDVRVLELPFGVRDGTFSLGNYTARTQFYQTRHGKAVIGGDLSRVSAQRVDAIRQVPMLNALIDLSEGKTLDATTLDTLLARGPGFIASSNIGYVVVDRDRASPVLIDFATRVFHLEELESDGAAVLYQPTGGEAISKR